MRKTKYLVALLLVAMPLSKAIIAQETAGEIRVENAFLRLVAEVEVAAREAGVIQSVAVQTGKEVSKGELLGKIDDQSRVLLKTKAQIEYEIAKAKAQSRTEILKLEEKLVFAESELIRGEKSKGKFDRSLSDSEIEKLRLEVTQDKLNLEEARLTFGNAQLKAKLSENELKMAEVILAKHRIESPVDGFVAEVFREAGEWVEPGEKVFRVIALKRLRVEGFVAASIPRSELSGKSVTVVVETKNKKATHIGSIQFVSREIDPVNQQIRIWATIENTDLMLEPGMRATMTINPTRHP